jgi:hypothetical protein
MIIRQALRPRSGWQAVPVLNWEARCASSVRDKLFHVSEEVQDALATGKPVVALETTIYTHGTINGKQVVRGH